MTSGLKFSPAEQAHILKYAYRKSWSHIARDLSRLYPDDNGGYRNGESVRNWYRDRERKETVDKVIVLIEKATVDLARTAGYTKNDLNELLLTHLTNILDKTY